MNFTAEEPQQAAMTIFESHSEGGYKDLWTYTSTEKAFDNFTPDETAKFNRNHLRTVAIMRSQMNERGYNLISDHTNAKVAWDEIKRRFTAKTPIWEPMIIYFGQRICSCF